MESMIVSDAETGKGIENLTLDEIIALNKLRNNKTEAEKDEIISVKSHKSHNGYFNKFDIDRRLRSIPGFGTNPIHHRLGYRGFKKRNPHYRNPALELAQRSLHKAKIAKWEREQRKPLNPLITFTNPDALNYVSPLTRNSVLKFNRLNNSGFLGNKFAPTRSVISNRPNFIRHSANKCLNPKIQEKIKELEVSGEEIDPDSLEEFSPVPSTSNTTTHLRFSTYV